jgi:hypothetical protein
VTTRTKRAIANNWLAVAHVTANEPHVAERSATPNVHADTFLRRMLWPRLAADRECPVSQHFSLRESADHEQRVATPTCQG